ncbi:MAG: DEAD/DEAH box helicase [Planctomycetota bacterium]|nr:DEAD/DEAH box helicase [Planctomycetota bacterium]
MAEASESGGWDVADSLAVLRSQIDPYVWEQGQELYRRGAVEDFAMQADGTVQVKVRDPRDARTFFVGVSRRSGGLLRSACPCPYRLAGFCRHQVVALEYLRAISEGEPVPGAEEPPTAGESTEPGQDARRPREGPVLYGLFDRGVSVSTQPDGSLLRAVLQELGGARKPHRLSLQLFTGTGWTELRTADSSRWIDRGRAGAHPRDALLAACFERDGALRSRIDSESLARVLAAVAGTGGLVDRTGRTIPVSPWPYRLGARLVRGAVGSIRVELFCRSPSGECVPLEEVSVVSSVAPWIQVESGAFHPLIAGAPGTDVEALQEEDYSEVPAAELERFLGVGVELLERLTTGAFEIEPGLIREVEGVDAARLRLEGDPTRLAGRLELSYGGDWVAAPESPATWTVERDGEIHRYPPAGQALTRARRELEALGFRREDGGDDMEWVLEGAGVLATVLARRASAFVRLQLPESLRALDLVDSPPTLELRIGASPESSTRGVAGPSGAGESPAEVSARGGSGVDWFEASFVLSGPDGALDVDLDALRAASAADPAGLLQLPDGAVVRLDHEPVRKLAELARAEAGGRLRLSLAEVSELLEERPGLEVDFDARVRQLADALRRSPDLAVPELEGSLDEILRPYQREAVGWFGGLARWGLAGILADEMGLGKTLMALSHLFGTRKAREAEGGAASRERPVLVVCPTSLVFNWLDECRRFFPRIEATGLYGLSPDRREEVVRGDAQLVVTSYALLRRDRELLESRSFRAVILDEGQLIKNPESQTAKAAFALDAGERWVLTGTPVENHLGELWSLFHFLMPGFLESSKEFQERFAVPIRAREDDAVEQLRRRVRPFVLRRTKGQVLRELPPCIEQVERAPLTELQTSLYTKYLRRARAELDSEEEGSSKARFRVLAALTRLRQICCHPRLVLDAESSGESSARAVAPDGDADERGASGGKFDLLLELLRECVEEGHRVLLFSQFTSMLDIIEEKITELDFPWCRLDGSTKDREAQVRRFQQDSGIPIFLISLKAGGYGLNLTQADTVILYDPWWNPAVEEQAAARAHRMGQSLPVHVHRLITAGTVEEKILELQAAKRDLAERVIGSGEEAVEALSFGDLRGLLGSSGSDLDP